MGPLTAPPKPQAQTHVNTDSQGTFQSWNLPRLSFLWGLLTTQALWPPRGLPVALDGSLGPPGAREVCSCLCLV